LSSLLCFWFWMRPGLLGQFGDYAGVFGIDIGDGHVPKVDHEVALAGAWLGRDVFAAEDAAQMEQVAVPTEGAFVVYLIGRTVVGVFDRGHARR